MEMSYLEALKRRRARFAARHGPDALLLKEFDRQIASVEAGTSPQQTRLHLGVRNPAPPVDPDRPTDVDPNSPETEEDG
jgi:hypothetical protein